jgi:autotransporter-associated beta strand protein
LSGGVLETNRVERGGGTGRFNFNGGTLRATGNSTTFVNGLTEAVVQLGGARIDTNGCSITIPQALLHDSTLGSVSDGGLTKIGAGTLILTGANTYSGGTVVTGGTLSVANDSFLGAPSGGITLQNNGRLVFTGSNVTTGRNFNLNYSSLSPAVNGTITYNGSTIIGGFLESPGHVIGSTGATLIGTTLTGSAAVNVNGPAAFQNVTNSGAISVPTGSTLTWVGTNAPSGLVTVQGSTNVANFTSSGYLNIHPGGTVTNTQGRMTLGGGSVTTIGLYNPANGQVTPGGTLNIGPGDLRVQGGFLRNNGVITGSGNLIIDYGGLVRGAGDIDLPQAPIRINGGQLLAGNSPGLTRITNFSLVSTGVTGGDFSNATGIAGPPIGSTGSQLSGWSVFEYGNSANTGGSAVIEGTPGNKAIWRFQTVLDSGNYSTPGPPANFDPGAAWIWQIVRPRSAADVGNPNNITPINTVAQISILDTATMQNVPLSNQNLNSYLRFDDSGWDWGSVPPGLRGTFSFTFLPDALGNPNRVVALVYTPVPEPGWMLSVVAAAFAGWQVRRRRISERWAPPVGRQSELPPAGRSET